VSDRDDRPPSDLDVSSEPEPDWADAIRRARRDRGERLKRMLGDEPEPGPSITPPPIREDTPGLEPPARPGRPSLRLIRSPEEEERER